MFMVVNSYNFNYIILYKCVFTTLRETIMVRTMEFDIDIIIINNKYVILLSNINYSGYIIHYTLYIDYTCYILENII